MRKTKSRVRAVLATLSVALLLTSSYAHAATSPSLGIAETFGILSSTYTNTTPGTVIDGDLGYTTGPAVVPTVNGTIYAFSPTYTQAGTAQGTALALLNVETCTHTFAPGAVDLASNLDFPTATYGPGVYCVTGAITLSAPGITLNGAGTYIFRSTAALDTSAGSAISLTGGANACDIWWTPTAAATLGANSTFTGTVISDAGITTGQNVTWDGRALAFGGTVSTDIDTLAVPSCGAAPTPAASLTVTKTVVNDDGGIMQVSDFPLFIGTTPVTSGIATTTLAPGAYTVSETGDVGYLASSWGGDCAADGSIVLTDGDVMTCTITNDDVEVAAAVSNTNSGSAGGGSRRREAEQVDDVESSPETIAVPSPSVLLVTDIPSLPNTGFGPDHTALYVLLIAATALGSLLSIGILRRRNARSME